MFSIPGKQAVSLTPAAVKQIVTLMEGKESKGLKLGLKKGGCAGMEYTMEFATEIDPMDEVVEQDGARLLSFLQILVSQKIQLHQQYLCLLQLEPISRQSFFQKQKQFFV